MAKWLGAPVLLVLDCSAIARSAAAVVKGYQEFDPALRLGGLLLNKVGGAAHTQWLRDALASAGLSLPVLGGIPKVRLPPAGCWGGAGWRGWGPLQWTGKEGGRRAAGCRSTGSGLEWQRAGAAAASCRKGLSTQPREGLAPLQRTPRHPAPIENLCSPHCVRQEEGVEMKERYLGLHLPNEPGGAGVPPGITAALAGLCRRHVDLDALLALARSAQVPPPPPPHPAAVPAGAGSGGAAPPPRIAVARDAAFCFYYQVRPAGGAVL